MARWSAFYLSFLLAVIFAALGVYYLIPGVYHPFTSDTVNETHAHLRDAAVYLALAALAVVAGRFAHPTAKE
jgi:hypothetical protein